MDNTLQSGALTINVYRLKKENCFVAHNLQTDICVAAKDKKEALKELKHLVMERYRKMQANNELGEFFRRASSTYWLKTVDYVLNRISTDVIEKGKFDIEEALNNAAVYEIQKNLQSQQQLELKLNIEQQNPFTPASQGGRVKATDLGGVTFVGPRYEWRR